MSSLSSTSRHQHPSFSTGILLPRIFFSRFELMPGVILTQVQLQLLALLNLMRLSWAHFSSSEPGTSGWIPSSFVSMQLGVIYKSAGGSVNPTVCVINKSSKRAPAPRHSPEGQHLPWTLGH